MGDGTEDEKLSEMMPRMPGRRAKKKGFPSKAGEPGGETDTYGCGGCGALLGSVSP